MTERVVARAALVGLSTPVILFGLGSYSLVNGDEGIYHYMARHMVETGDWFRLEFTGEERVYDTFTHAPLYLWAKALVILAFGDNYFSMRLLSASLGILSLLATHRLVETLANPRAAFLAALVQLTTFQFVYLHAARTGEMETALALASTLAVLFFLRAIETGRSFAAHHLCLIALLNLKLAIIAVPVMAEAAYFAVYPAARGRMRDWLTTACWMIPLGLSWHVYQSVVHWDELGVVIRELLGQSAGAAAGYRHDLGLLGQIRYYATHLVFGAFPHALLYPWAVVVVLVAARRGNERSGWMLLALNVAAVFIFFLLIAIHTPWYLMPAIPLLSAFTGAALDRLTREIPRTIAQCAIAIAIVFAASIRFPILDFNPFAERAALAAPAMRWGELEPVWGSVLLLAILACGAVARVRAVRPGALAFPLIAALLMIAAVRVVAPLQFVHHESGMARLRAELDAARSAGTEIAYPVTVPEGGKLKARYYFGDDHFIHRLSRAKREHGEFFALHEKRGQPARKRSNAATLSGPDR